MHGIFHKLGVRQEIFRIPYLHAAVYAMRNNAYISDDRKVHAICATDPGKYSKTGSRGHASRLCFMGFACGRAANCSIGSQQRQTVKNEIWYCSSLID